MQSKLQELTDKIYREGIEKGKSDANAIIENAKAQAQEIINAAHAQEKKILDNANQKALELKQNTESEIKLAMRQALNSMKQQVSNLITGKVTSDAVKSISSDNSFLRDIILSIAQNWNPAEGGSQKLEVVLPASKEKELREFLLGNAGNILKKGIELKFDSRLNNGFEIGPADGGYRISFTDEVFENFFREYLRPRIMDYLFAK